MLDSYKLTMQGCWAAAGWRCAAVVHLIQVESVTMPTVVFILHILIIAVHLWSHVHHFELDLSLLTKRTTDEHFAASVCVVCVAFVWRTCCDRMVTASLCLASRKLMLLTARMASPTCRPPHRSAGWLGWISEIRMGTPCSFPPCSQNTCNYHQPDV